MPSSSRDRPALPSNRSRKEHTRTWCLAAASLLPLAPLDAQVVVIDPPAAAKSALPNLAVTPTGGVLLSWVEPVDGGHRLVFAAAGAERWSAKKTIASGSNWFVNWADFPSLVAAGDGSLVAHWLVKSAAGTYDYDVTMARSADGGAIWSEPFMPHRDGVAAEHGFVSLLPMPGSNTVAAFWLDGREMAKQPRGGMTLRHVSITANGKLEHDALLDPRVCECCQTSAAMTSAGPIVVYRDRSDDEVRDIFCVRQVDGIWTKPRAIHADGWQLGGCPVNGPSIAAAGTRVAVAWFTAANGAARVQVAFSNDAGATFGEPLLVDGEAPTGQVAIAIGNDADAHVCWLSSGAGAATIRCCRVRVDGGADEAFDVARTSAARSSGFPRMVRVGNELWFAWTDGTVHSALAKLK